MASLLSEPRGIQARLEVSVADPEVLIFIGVKLILAHHYTIEPVGILSTLV